MRATGAAFFCYWLRLLRVTTSLPLYQTRVSLWRGWRPFTLSSPLPSPGSSSEPYSFPAPPASPASSAKSRLPVSLPEGLLQYNHGKRESLLSPVCAVDQYMAGNTGKSEAELGFQFTYRECHCQLKALGSEVLCFEYLISRQRFYLAKEAKICLFGKETVVLKIVHHRVRALW